MSDTVTINTRVPKALKLEAEAILAELGLNLTDAVKIFLSQVKLQRGLPFQVQLDSKYADSLTLATQLRKDEMISTSRAAEIAGMSLWQFKESMAAYNVKPIIEVPEKIEMDSTIDQFLKHNS